MKLSDYTQYLSPALAKSTDLVISRGEGAYIYTESGEKYLDFVQGIAVGALGHCHPRVVKAIQDQAATLINGSFNMVSFPTTLELAKKLDAILPGDLGCTFFSNGGAEATDGALKLAKAATHRPAVIACKGSFHGRTIGATSVTGSNSKYRKDYEPMMGSVYFMPYPTVEQCPAGLDIKARADFCIGELMQLFRYLVDPKQVAAIIVEPVQGEGGYVVPDTSFMTRLREITAENGIMLIMDEIQSGYGRTGKMFACENYGIIPDIMTLGKAIGGGLPMSAIVSTKAIMDEWHPGQHGTTFGGNPLVAAAALAVLEEFEASGILANVNAQGTYLRSKLEELQKAYSSVLIDVRGLGLMQAVEFSTPEQLSGMQKYCLDHKLMTLSCGLKALRFATPLNVTKEILDEGLAIFTAGLETVK